MFHANSQSAPISKGLAAPTASQRCNSIKRTFVRVRVERVKEKRRRVRESLDLPLCVCVCGSSSSSKASQVERKGEGLAEGGSHGHTADEGLHCVPPSSLLPPLPVISSRKRQSSHPLRGDSSVESILTASPPPKRTRSNPC